jgi:hypothetical protein
MRETVEKGGVVELAVLRDALGTELRILWAVPETTEDVVYGLGKVRFTGSKWSTSELLRYLKDLRLLRCLPSHCCQTRDSS